MMVELELLIVVINYKTLKMTIDCLNSVIPQLQDRQKIVVVDNHSGDGSAEAIDDWIHKNNHSDTVSIIYSKDNLGFSGGNNLGISHKTANYYLLLNSDTIIRNNALQILVETAKQNPDAGLVSPRLEWPDQTPQISCFKFYSPVTELIHTASTAPITKLLHRWDIPIPITDTPTYPQWTSFACVLIKKEVFDDVGLMDDGYFLYFEDIDFCRLAHNKNWKTLNNPAARVVHLRGGSSDVKKSHSSRKRVPRYYYASRSRYYFKHFGLFGLLRANVYWYLGRAVSLFRETFGKKECTICEKQHIDIWTDFLSETKSFRNKS